MQIRINCLMLWFPLTILETLKTYNRVYGSYFVYASCTHFVKGQLLEFIGRALSHIHPSFRIPKDFVTRVMPKNPRD
ncbi:hypothetical protein V8C42DRAFT_334020 [Trichoderma barbatum]